MTTLIAIIGFHNLDLTLANNLEINTENRLTTDHSPVAISSNFDNRTNNFRLTLTDKELLAKKSGGRSGGGSFKSRPSRSSSPKRRSPSSRSSNKRKSSTQKSVSPSYKNSQPKYRTKPSPTYRQSTPVPVYQDRGRNSSTYNRSTGNYHGRSHNQRWTGVNTVALILILLIVGGLIFVIFFLIFKVLVGALNPKEQSHKKIIIERDNDLVTISMLQIALSSEAANLQQDLSELSLTVDTDTDEGLVELMREAALTLLRNEYAWTHVSSSSNSLNINQAEEAFNKFSFAERSKFSSETLNNVDGKVKTRQFSDSSSDSSAGYIVVTLILGTADDRPLFTRINTEENLKEALLQLSTMRDDYLIKLELLWTPQTANEYLTDEELLMEYTNIMLLA